MRSRKRHDTVARYVLTGAIALVILAAGLLVLVIVKKRPAATETVAQPAAKSEPAAATATVARTPANTGPALPAAKVEEKPTAISSDELRQLHAGNEAAAAQRFKDKLQVTGAVSMIYQEAPLVGIGFGTLQDSVPPVLCEMQPQQVSGLSQLRRGQVVTVVGTYQGKIQGGFIGLGGCRIVAASPEVRP